jgi:CRP-like cAMP-binding protein
VIISERAGALVALQQTNCLVSGDGHLTGADGGTTGVGYDGDMEECLVRTHREAMRLSSLDESLLDHVQAFSRLSLGQRRQVLDQAANHFFERGTHIFEEDRPADRFYLLLDGYVRVARHTEAGDQVILLHIPSGELIGIAPAFQLETYPATAIAVNDCVSLSWPAGYWNVLVEHYPGFAAEAMKSIGVRFREFNDRIVELATLQVEQRIAHMVLRLVNQAGRKTDEGIEIDLPITRQDLSEMTGSTLHTVSRLLSAWEKKGWVKSSRGRIVVMQPHQLVLLSEGRN